MKPISEKILQSTFFQMYDLSHVQGRGRALILTHYVLDLIITTLITGAFYTSFLTLYGIDIVSVGILTFVPYIAQLFSLVTPYILERMPKRRWFLAGCRSLYFLLYILGVTVLPEIVRDPDARLPWLVGLIFAANIIHAPCSQGYTVWHAQYLPNAQRFSYFLSRILTGNSLSCILAILLSVIADMTAGTAFAKTVIIGVRYAALAVGALDIVILMRVKEYPYPRQEKIRLSDVFRTPLKNKKFMRTMAVCFIYTFGCYLCPLNTGVFMYYLLNDAGAPNSLPYTLDLFYSLFLVFFYSHWNRKLERDGWIKVFNVGNLLQLVSLVLMAFVNRGTVLWLFPLLKMFQHYFSVGYGTSYTNFMYMNTPAEGQTNYITFYTVGSSLFTFLGLSAGTWFVGAVGEGTLTVLGYQLSAVPLLLILQGALFGVLYLFVRWAEPMIKPDIS